MKETAVDFAVEQLEKLIPSGNQIIIGIILDKAKQMEKQQIIEAHGKQLKKTGTAGNYDYWLTGEQYYRENY